MKGTDPPRCRSHLGRKAEVVKAEYYAARQAQAAYKLLGAELTDGITDPLTELLKLGKEVLVWKKICQEMLGGLSEIRYKSAGSGEQLRAEVALYERSLERAAKLLADLARLGIEERLAAISEEQGAAVVRVIESVLRDPAVGLSSDQLRAGRVVAAHYLRALRPTPAADAAGAAQ
jgi:hypothetical protein